MIRILDIITDRRHHDQNRKFFLQDRNAIKNISHETYQNTKAPRKYNTDQT